MGFWTNIKHIFRRGSGDTATESSDSGASVSAARLGNTHLLISVGSTALSIATVFRCVRLLSESVANLPIKHMRLKDGIFKADGSDLFNYLLTVQPTGALSAYDFWTKIVIDMLLDGNAYVIPIYSPVTMHVDRLALCGRGTVVHDTINDTYDVYDSENGIMGYYGEDEVLHFKNLSLDGKCGLSTLTYARLTSSIAETGDKETLSRFSNGGNVRGILTNDNTVRGFGEYQDKELEKAAKSMDDRFNGGNHIVSLPGQVDFKQISLNSTDMQFLESRKFTVREICRFFGVHPSYVFDDTSNNYKSAEMANVAFLSTTLNPILRRIEVELLRKLVAPSLAHKQKFEFDRRALYACDLDSRVKYQAATIATGIYTVNDWRREENRAPVEGGDTVLISANLKGISETGSEQEKTNNGNE